MAAAAAAHRWEDLSGRIKGATEDSHADESSFWLAGSSEWWEGWYLGIAGEEGREYVRENGDSREESEPGIIFKKIHFSLSPILLRRHTHLFYGPYPANDGRHEEDEAHFPSIFLSFSIYLSLYLSLFSSLAHSPFHCNFLSKRSRFLEDIWKVDNGADTRAHARCTIVYRFSVAGRASCKDGNGTGGREGGGIEVH